MLRVVTIKSSWICAAIISLVVSSFVQAQNHIWESNGNTNWTRSRNWGGSGQPGGNSGYGGTTGRLEFRGRAEANYDPLGQGFGAAISTFSEGRGLVIANTEAGSLAISSGEIRLVNSVESIDNAPAMGNFGNASLTITGTGRLDASGNVNDFFLNWAGSATNTSTVTVNGSNAQFIGNRFNLRQSSGGTGTVNVLNGGTLEVNQITHSAGTGANVLNFDGGTLRARVSNQAFFGTTGTNLANTTVNIQSGGLTVNTNGFNIGIGQSLGTGGGGITKSGAGELTLSGSNSYTGITSIQDGVLILNGRHTGGGNYTVATNAAIGGNGSTTSILVANGRVFAGNQGNDLGELTAGRLQLNSSSRSQLQLNSTTNRADRLNASSSGLSISSGAVLELEDLGSTSVTPGTKLSLASYNGGWNGGLWTFQGNLLANNSEIVVGLNRWLFRYDDASAGANPSSGTFSGFVTIQAIPEPNTLALVGLCIVSAAGFNMRRRKRPVS